MRKELGITASWLKIFGVLAVYFSGVGAGVTKDETLWWLLVTIPMILSGVYLIDRAIELVIKESHDKESQNRVQANKAYNK